MKKICLFLSIVLLFSTVSAVNGNHASAAANQIVKIGLYYSSTAQSQIGISADKGVSFNAFDSAANTYIPVYDSKAGETTTIRKDSYFTGSGSSLTPAAAGSATSGPVHIKIQSTYNSYEDTLPVIQTYKQKGIAAYPVYTDSGWNIWTGFYVDEAKAQKAVETVKSKLGANTYAVIDKSDTRIYGANGAGEVVFMYASAKKLLRGESLSKEDPNPIKIGTALYRGQVEFLRQSGSDMTVINVLPMEEYLYGVIPNEMEAYSNPEALKAQAVAARTYSYVSINKHASLGFNLCPTTDCHVYKGLSSESPISNKAVDDTRDMVVTYNGKLAETVYFSSSGGRTEDAANVWGNSIPYLVSVEDKYESGKSYKYNWEMSFTVDEISQKLKSQNIGTVTGMEITKYSASGRPIEIVVKGTAKPEGVVITKDRCRTFLSLYSQWYDITTDADVNVKVNDKVQSTQLSQLKVVTANGQTSYDDPGQKVTVVGANGTTATVSATPTKYNFVNGKGWGHSVGMSQEGAKGMANAGFTYDQILTHYYTGTKIELKK